MKVISSLVEIVNLTVFGILGTVNFLLCYFFGVLDFFCNPHFRKCYCLGEITPGERRLNSLDYQFNGRRNGGLDGNENLNSLSSAVDLNENIIDNQIVSCFVPKADSSTTLLKRTNIFNYLKSIVLGRNFNLFQNPFPFPISSFQMPLPHHLISFNGHFLRPLNSFFQFLKGLPLIHSMRNLFTYSCRRKVQILNTSTWSDCKCSECESYRKGECSLHLNSSFSSMSLTSLSQSSSLSSLSSSSSSSSISSIISSTSSSVLPNSAPLSPSNSVDFSKSISIDQNIHIANCSDKNIVFIHGFLSSSSFWSETIMPFLPSYLKDDYHLCTIDLLGWGRSPKPSDSNYLLKDHIEWIERSVICKYKMKKFEIVAHSMGCVVALALAAKFPHSVSSIVLISPPTSDLGSENLNESFLKQVAPKRVFPLLQFGISVMSWYEHIGRLICAVFLKFHFFWIPFLNFVLPKVTSRRFPKAFIRDFLLHTHHSAFLNFHNTLCEGVQYMDVFLNVMDETNVKVTIVHGYEDVLCCYKGSQTLASNHSCVNLIGMEGDHISVVLGKEKQISKLIGDAISDQ